MPRFVDFTLEGDEKILASAPFNRRKMRRAEKKAITLDDMPGGPPPPPGCLDAPGGGTGRAPLCPPPGARIPFALVDGSPRTARLASVRETAEQ